MGQMKFEPQNCITEFANVLGEQLQETPDSLFNAPKPQQGYLLLDLAIAVVIALAKPGQILRPHTAKPLSPIC